MSLQTSIGIRPDSFPWRNYTDMPRSFVRYPNPHPGAVKIAHHPPLESNVILSVIIPTSDAYRDGYFPRLLEQIHSQSMQSFELIVICGDPRQGRAINKGAAMARGKYLLTLDDDTSLPDGETFSKLVAAMEDNPRVGMAGGNNVIPKDATAFVRKAMEQVPRRSWQPVGKITDSDLAEHPCLIMRADVFRAVGGENELIPRGLDPYLRQVFRKAGWRVVVVPGIVYHHLPPCTCRKLIGQFFRNGRQAAFVNRRYPQWVIETPARHGEFKPQAPLPMRVLRFFFHLLEAAVRGKPLWMLGEMAYALGFATECFLGMKNHLAEPSA